MATVSTSFTSSTTSSVLSVSEASEVISVAISGTYAATIRLEKAVGSNTDAWETVATWSTANATVAADFNSGGPNTKWRLHATSYTSGTAVTTVSDGDKPVADVPGQTRTQAGVTEDGTLTVTGDFVASADITQSASFKRTSGTVVSLAAADALTEDEHAGRVVVVTGTTGIAITLPEATGTGNVYTIFYSETVSSGSHTIVAPSASTDFSGAVAISTDIAGVTIIANAGDDTITMNGSTTGGLVGTWFRFTDVITGTFMLEGALCSTGAEADPFSAAV